MLPKLNRVRRIKYKGDELYVMLKRHAPIVLPHVNVFGIEDYEDDTIVIINAEIGLRYGVCASSDIFDDGRIRIAAAFDVETNSADTQKEWKPYNFSPLHAAMSSLAVTYSGLTEDDHLKVKKNKNKSFDDNFMDYINISAAANEQLEIRAAINIFYNGLSDYAEAENDLYKETQFFSDWGTGEESSAVLNGQPVYYEKRPSYLGFFQKDIVRLFQAIKNPDWHDVPYIKLMAENGDILL